jgi:hypothetical protein
MPTTNITPSITPATIAFNSAATAANLNSSFTPLNNFASAIDDLRDLGVVASSTPLVQNRDIMAAMNAASGNRFFTLPSAAGQRFPITLKKADSSNKTVTIIRSGSDFIEDPTNPAISPTATSFVLRQPDEAVTLYPFGTTQWRVVKHYMPNRIYAGASKSASQTVSTGGWQIIEFDNDSTAPAGFDPLGFFNTSTHRFQPRIPGRYLVTASVTFDPGSSAYGAAAIYLSGSRLITSTDSNVAATGRIVMHVTGVAPLNGSTQYVDIRVFMNSSSRDVNTGAGDTNVRFDYLGVS